MPKAAARALELEALAQRYHCTPAQILREPAWLLQHVAIVELVSGDG
jgi:hypothetical protein